MYLMPKITVNEFRTGKPLNVTATTTMETNFSIEKFELLKQAHLKQNRELIRANTNYASRIHKLENSLSLVKFENLELRTRLIHVERQLKLKEERLGMILQQLFLEEEEEENEVQAIAESGDDNTDAVTATTVVKGHQLPDIKSSLPKRWNEGTEQKQCLKRELHIMSTTDEDDAGDDKPPLKKERVDPAESVTIPTSSKPVGLCDSNMSIIGNNGNKENDSTVQLQQQLLLMEEEEHVLDNSAMGLITMTEEEQIELMDSSDDDMMGYSIEPPLSPEAELLASQQQYEQEEQQQQKGLIFIDNKRKMIEMSDSNNVDIIISKEEEETMDQKSQEGKNIMKGDAKIQQQSENNWINNQSITTTANTPAATTVALCSNKRFRTPKSYKLPSVKKKLRQGDPFTFDYQNTSPQPSSSQ